MRDSRICEAPDVEPDPVSPTLSPLALHLSHSAVFCSPKRSESGRNADTRTVDVPSQEERAGRALRALARGRVAASAEVAKSNELEVEKENELGLEPLDFSSSLVVKKEEAKDFPVIEGEAKAGERSRPPSCSMRLCASLSRPGRLLRLLALRAEGA